MKATYIYLIERFRTLYNEIEYEVEELNYACSEILSQRKEEYVVYSNEEKIDTVLKKVKISLIPFLEELDFSAEDGQLTDIRYYLATSYTYTQQVYDSNLTPTILSDSLNVLLERITYVVKVWNLKVIFLTCQQTVKVEECKNYKDILLACYDKADRIAQMID